MKKLILVIPAYREAARWPGEAYQRYLAGHPELSLLLVDDGNTDETPARLRELQTLFPQQIEILTLKRNCGKAEAVRQGMLLAAPQTEWVGFWDADLATPFRESERMLAAFEENPSLELCFGCRLKRLGVCVERHLGRHYVGRIIATYLSNCLDLPVYDTQCGAKIFRSETVETLFREPFVTRWLFDVEILHRYQSWRGRDAAYRRILELPLNEWHDVEGSTLTWKSGGRILRELWRIGRLTRFGRK